MALSTGLNSEHLKERNLMVPIQRSLEKLVSGGLNDRTLLTCVCPISENINLLHIYFNELTLFSNVL